MQSETTQQENNPALKAPPLPSSDFTEAGGWLCSGFFFWVIQT
jgi:hypothetical protein